MEEQSHGAEKLIINPYERDGLSITYPVSNHRVDLKFDGKRYSSKDVDRAKAESTAGTRVDSRFITLEHQIGGKTDETEELKVSAENTTLTTVSRSIKAGAIFTSVWDRKQ